MADLTVRPVSWGDLDAWLPLWDGYNSFYGRAGETALPTDVTHATWARFFDDDEPVHALVAVRDGKLVGLVHYLFHRSTTALDLTCYLQDLFTDPDVRGGGIGRALIEAVYARAAAAGSSRVYWQTHETNATARRLYDQVAELSPFRIYRRTV